MKLLANFILNTIKIIYSIQLYFYTQLIQNFMHILCGIFFDFSIIETLLRTTILLEVLLCFRKLFYVFFLKHNMAH